MPQLPPSSMLLKKEWYASRRAARQGRRIFLTAAARAARPRLQRYAITSPADPLWATCESGAAGDEKAAVDCIEGWRARVPAVRQQLQTSWETIFESFPNHDADGKPLSGAYWNECDYSDPEWQTSHWGVHYPRLLDIKRRYDPQGLFVCHHCVGSEAWSADGNCRVA